MLCRKYSEYAFTRVAQNDSLATLLARLEGILGPVPRALMREGRYSQRYYTRSGALFDRNPRTVRLLSQPCTSKPHVKI